MAAPLRTSHLSVIGQMLLYFLKGSRWGVYSHCASLFRGTLTGLHRSTVYPTCIIHLAPCWRPSQYHPLHIHQNKFLPVWWSVPSASLRTLKGGLDLHRTGSFLMFTCSIFSSERFSWPKWIPPRCTCTPPPPYLHHHLPHFTAFLFLWVYHCLACFASLRLCLLFEAMSDL